MADTNTGTEGAQAAAGAESEATDTSANNDGAASKDDGGGGDTKGDDDKGGDAGGDDSKKDDTKSDDGKSKGEDDDEPPPRKSNSWWVAKRRGDKIEKITKKEGDDSKGDDGKGEEGKGGGDDLDSRLDAKLDERLEPLAREALEKEVDGEIASIIADEPKFAPYKDKVRKWALHPSRENVPIQSIFYEVAGKDLMKLGAEKAKDADEEAKHSAGTGGGATGADGTGKSVWDMTPEEFAAEQLRIRAGGGQAQA